MLTNSMYRIGSKYKIQYEDPISKQIINYVASVNAEDGKHIRILTHKNEESVLSKTNILRSTLINNDKTIQDNGNEKEKKNFSQG